MQESNQQPSRFGNLPNSLGQYTVLLHQDVAQANPTPVRDAYLSLTSEIIPFVERLCDYASSRLGTDDLDELKAILKAQSAAKGLGFSTPLLNNWLNVDRREVNLSTASIFKLCLAFELSPDEALHFVYDCLYQNWFNPRTVEGLVYTFCLENRQILGNHAYAFADDFIRRFNADDAYDTIADQPQHDYTGYTQLLDFGLRELNNLHPQTEADVASILSDYLNSNRVFLTGVKRSALRTYRTYLMDGGIGLKPLTVLYREQTGLTLPETSYLDMTGVVSGAKTKRLLWGTMSRKAWLQEEGNTSDWDILNEGDIRLEHHAVERMYKKGIVRGNIIALLFFHFCLEHTEDCRIQDNRHPLFDQFYETTNYILADECGMMPLHPRKPFDRLFMQSLALSWPDSPIDYLNKVLERYYRV